MKASASFEFPKSIQKQWKKITASYSKEFQLTPFLTNLEGASINAKDDPLRKNPAIRQARAFAINESIRWGEPFVTFLMPNVVTWAIPIERNQTFFGAISGGDISFDNDIHSQEESINHLVKQGTPRAQATRYIKSLPVWDNPVLTHQATAFLFEQLYKVLGHPPVILKKNNLKQVQQRQIAEQIHEIKRSPFDRSSMQIERQLLNLMKAGDLRAARGVLNRTLGIMFSQTSDLTLLRAQSIEMMGYLVRAAVEDNPALGLLIQKNHLWMTRIIKANDFEEICRGLQEALDEFMNNMSMFGHSAPCEVSTRILAWLEQHFHENITLDKIAATVGLSTFRVAHILKKSTGKSMLQHVHQLRIQEAQRLLQSSDLSSADIAYETGFSEQSYFIRQFKKLVGVTPEKYRKRFARR